MNLGKYFGLVQFGDQLCYTVLFINKTYMAFLKIRWKSKKIERIPKNYFSIRNLHFRFSQVQQLIDQKRWGRKNIQTLWSNYYYCYRFLFEQRPDTSLASFLNPNESSKINKKSGDLHYFDLSSVQTFHNCFVSWNFKWRPT